MPTGAVGGGLERLWARRGEIFCDISSDLALWHAIGDSITLPGEGKEWANIEITRAVCELLYDRYAPAGIRSPSQVTEDQLAQAGISREQLDYWVARERIAAVENGFPVEDVVPGLGLARRQVSRLWRLPRRAPRARAARRRVRRTARAPDDPSRPRPSRLGAVPPRLGRRA